ncbi:MAG: VWA domain-containing protein [Clostridia bacterium]|nr:VWA domain-containing protein [Clostridia bacterium]
MSSINFDNVYLLFIAVPLLALLAVPFFIAIKKENANGHNIASMVLHVLMAVIIAFAAAGTQIVTVITETNVYVLADVSYSANKNLDTVDNYISNLSKNLPRNSKLGIVCFGKDYVQLTSLGGSIKSVKTAEVDDTETNIAEAMEYTGSLFKDGVIKRLVVITDGRQTYSGDANQLRRTVSNLQGQNVHVDAIFLDDTLSDDAKEVQISSAEFTKKTYLGHKEEVTLNLQSSFATTNTTVEIYKDGELLESKRNRPLPVGISTISFALDTSEKGVYNYQVKLSDSNDESNLNNTYSFTQTVSGEVKVLFVGSKQEDGDYINEIYGEEAEIDSFINDENMPTTLEALCGYDEIVLSDVDLTTVIPYRYEAFMQNVNTAVSAFGKSLVTFGNMSIQDKPLGELQQLDDMLPVRYGDAIDSPKLYTIVLDVSHSMNMWSRMIIAKIAAKNLLKSLSDDDYVSVVAFSGSTEQVLPPTSLRNRDDVSEYISNLKFEQGTLISAGLSRAFNMIKTLNYSEKQVMLITDGISYDDYSGEESGDVGESRSLVISMRGYGIYTSVICVGGGNDSYRETMREIARQGGGSYFWAPSEDDVAGISFNEIAKDDSDTEITIEEGVIVSLNKPRDSLIAGDEESGLTNVGFTSDSDFVTYYVLSKAKSSATTVLTVKYEYVLDDVRSDIDVPLFAYWNYGNGKVASYAGKLRELKQYGGVESERNNPFFKNILTYAVPEEKIDAPFTVTTELDGKSAIVQLTPGERRSRATAQMSVTSPSGAQDTYTLTFDSMTYSQQFRASEVGRYTVTLTYSLGGTDYTTETYLDVSYEPEYDSFAVYDASVLHKMLGGDGTVSLDGKLSIVNDESEQETYILRLAMPLMATAVVLFVVDIIIRKLKWKDIVSLFGLGRGSKKDKGKK